MRNTNNKVVKTRKPHNCMHCNIEIAVGTECRTLSVKGYDRGWLCKNCERVYLDCLDAVDRLGSTPFGDEGAYLANKEYVNKVYQLWFDIQDGTNTFLDHYLLDKLNKFN